MSTPINDATDTAGREIISTRAFDFSLEQIWEAWTNPALLAQWLGPNGFTNTFSEFDLRPDGNWRFVMHGPDGRDYKNHSVFREITPCSRIVFDHVTAPFFQVIATFTSEAGKTRVTFRMLFDTVETCNAVKGIVVGANEENFDRFSAVLKKMDLPKERGAGRELVLTRIIDLPRELL
ncbi:MAG TPA: SRPBCC family protein, partial [Roseimicrobium sp.]|nr:SRPBCC family protein [Roseimicrobium sp.]